jgi:ribosomal protein RSM22 (predicted rRNA methylase)
MTPDLPAELKVALSRKAEGLSRNDAAQRASVISERYRSGGGSGAIRTETDALAYALARMPATYAAVASSLNALLAQRPDFSPSSLLDVGAGPGTASWAALQAFGSLATFDAVDSNSALRSLAVDLASNDARLSAWNYNLAQGTNALPRQQEADLVIASYVINELDETDRTVLTDLLWEKTRDVLLVIEPGTPSGYQRILDARALLIAKGAHVIAPCPHDRTCPLAAPDWCHFSQRLSRSRAHKQLKNADAPFEDERFIYVALTRTAKTHTFSRVLSQPAMNKIAVTAKLCTPQGLQTAVVPRRNKTDFAPARRWDWGDAVSFEPQKA